MHEYDDIYYTYYFKDFNFNWEPRHESPQPKRSRFDDGNVVNMTQDATGSYTPDGIIGK